ncbi:hypothetical protein M8C21_007258 [Ambrosia artemisiifolia]|uniref:Subtilisin-like protease SBT1.7 n=1 Tax=Ambrosia artemisiifolia TaxID=4212 RepID=A0AAD5CI85_AMBAR|nr:hypothetical protein M8C21_007258 [Ambrosia artemisiifolia]
MKPMNVFLMAVMVIVCYCYAAADDQRKTYIVHMDKSVMPMAYSNHLHWYEATMRVSVSTPTDMLYAYDKVMHGFSTRLTIDEAKLLKQRHGIVSVQEEPIYQLHTTRSPEFLGLEVTSDVMVPESNSGSDVIVGVVDGGVWPGHKSLDDTGFAPVPSRWKGECQSGRGFNKSSCNRKLIGARYFLKAHEALLNGTFDENVKSRSPLDDDGHGTHCATTAVGSAVSRASLFGYAKGTARGVAPHARLAVYKACWLGNCAGSDILSAVEAAISDGVDILSMSFGNPFDDYFLHPIAYVSFKAVSHGIFISTTAGNDGPAPLSVTNIAPWVITVGASSLDRDFPAYVTLGNGKNFSGVSLYTSEEPLSASMLPLVFAGNITNITNSNLCIPGSLPPGSVTGKIVMCEMGLIPNVRKGMVVKAAGGVGMILANTVYRLKELEVDLHLIPTLLDVVTGKPATPFDLGAGHVDPKSALNPGLVYNTSTDDYMNFLCALNYSSTQIKTYYDKNFECVKGKKYRVEDLNYPSFEVPLSAASGQTVVKYTRTLTNVGTPETYKVSTLSKTHAVKIKVEPEELTFIEKNEKKVYTVTFTATSMPPNTTGYGRLAWSGGKYVVSSPIAFIWE